MLFALPLLRLLMQVTPHEDGSFTAQLSALREKSIKVVQAKEEGGSGAGAGVAGRRWLAYTTINGETDVVLKAIHVQMGKTFIPSVAYIEIFGEDGAYEMVEKVQGSGSAVRQQRQTEGFRT
jgi:hypothetical protein